MTDKYLSTRFFLPLLMRYLALLLLLSIFLGFPFVYVKKGVVHFCRRSILKVRRKVQKVPSLYARKKVTQMLAWHQNKFVSDRYINVRRIQWGTKIYFHTCSAVTFYCLLTQGRRHQKLRALAKNNIKVEELKEITYKDLMWDITI